MTNRTKITMAAARAIAPVDGRDAVLWDSAASGLGLWVRANGRKTWIVHRRCNGSVIKRTLDTLDSVTGEDAGYAARALLAGTQVERVPAAVPTMRTFADKDTETVWLDRRVRRFQSIQAQAKRRLNVLNAITTLEDLRNNPGARLHRLSGDREGQWAIAINEQYRIVFDWNDGSTNVEITDYHR